MSSYSNAQVLHEGTVLATNVTVVITEDSAKASVSGGQWSSQPTVGLSYLLTDNNQLDWEGRFTGKVGHAYDFTVSG